VLLPDRVVPFLQHESYDVRAHAADYLAKAHDPSPATAEHFWQSIDRFGTEKSVRLITRLAAMPQTEASLGRLLRALRDGVEEEFRDGLLQACEDIDFPLLQAHRNEILTSKEIAPDVRDHLRQRLALSDHSVDDLWERLQRHSDKVDNKYWGEFDVRVSERLVEALARHGEPAARLAMERLAKPLDDWMRVFAVQLLGRLRHGPAAERLVELLSNEEADLLAEEVVNALSRIGTPAVVERLEAFYQGAAWGPRVSSVEPFARIKRPESERALLRLLEAETEPDLLTFLAAALCDLCTTEGIEAVRRLIIEDRYDPEPADLELMLLTVGTMVGYEPPEAAEWRLNPSREKRERSRAERFPSLHAVLKGFDGPDIPTVSMSPPGASEEESRREAQRVGRNDPCPCGSGKKYKKCCLNAANA
jgi:HEAT repeat protein